MTQTNPYDKETSVINVFIMTFYGIITYIKGTPTPKRVWHPPPLPPPILRFYFINLSSCEITNQQAEFDKKQRNDLK